MLDGRFGIDSRIAFPRLRIVVGGTEALITLSALIIKISLRARLVTGIVDRDDYGPAGSEEIINFLISSGFSDVNWTRAKGSFRSTYSLFRGISPIVGKVRAIFAENVGPMLL